LLCLGVRHGVVGSRGRVDVRPLAERHALRVPRVDHDSRNAAESRIVERVEAGAIAIGADGADGVVTRWGGSDPSLLSPVAPQSNRRCSSRPPATRSDCRATSIDRPGGCQFAGYSGCTPLLRSQSASQVSLRLLKPHTRTSRTHAASVLR